MKKLVLWLIVLAMIFACLSGCAQQNTAGSEKGSPAASSAASESKAAMPSESSAAPSQAAASETGKKSDGSKLRIVYLVPSKDILYWQWVEDGVKQACEAIGATCTSYDAQNDAAKQLNNANTAIIQGVDGIVLSPVSSPSCKPVLDAAEQAKIPVTIAAIGPDKGVTNYACLVTADDYTSGYENGKYLCDKVKALGGGTIGVLSLPLDRTNAQNKMAGLEKACKEKGVEICQVLQTEGLTVNEATQQANDLITSHPDMKGIYGMYEQAGLGAVTAVKDSKLEGKIAIVSSDGSPESIKYVREGKIAGIVVQEAVGQGLVATQQLIKVTKGEKVDAKDIPLPEPLVTTDNIEDAKIQEILKLVYPASAGAY